MNRRLPLINAAKKPYVLVGGGAILSDAAQEVRAFVKKLQAPVADTLMGKGAFPGTDDLYTGMLGMHGTKTANFGVSQCDLLVVLGARFSDRVIGNAAKFASQAKIVQLDIDPAEVNKNIHVTASVTGDLKASLEKLTERIAPQDHAEWLAKIQELKAQYPLKYDHQRTDRPGSHRRDLSGNKGRGHYHHRCGPASDVGSPVL